MASDEKLESLEVPESEQDQLHSQEATANVDSWVRVVS